MKTKAFFAFLAAIVLLTVIAADPPPQASGVIHFANDKVAAAMAKGSVLLATNNFRIQGGHRTGPGKVEIHEQDTDIFYVLEGTATIVTGGQTLEPKVTGPGETSGREISGGESRQLAKGDVLIIPNGVPHWFKEVDGSFVYYVVKVRK